MDVAIEKFDTKALDKIIKGLKLKKLPTIKIGILGSDHGRTDNQSNATIGAFHEFGTTKMPKRSFLKTPIQENLGKKLEAAGAFTDDTVREVIATGGIKPWLTKIMIMAEAVVAEGFDTGGFGKWKPSKMKYKKVQQTLIETQQLRNSITAVIVG